MERREEFCEGLMVTQDNRRRRKTGGLPPLVAVMLFLTSTTGNALAADDKACSQQERTNKTLSEKLTKQPALFVRPRLILPSRHPHPTPGRHRLSRHRAARVAIRPSSLSDPCDRGTASQVSIDAIWKSDKVSLAVLRKALSWTGDASAAVSGASACEASGWCAPRLTGTGSWLR